MDESGLTTVQSTQKVIALKGKKQVGAITSAERGVHCTVVCCMSSAGTFIPPAVVFPRKRWKQELGDNGPAGTLNMCQESGWKTGELFYQWLQHFVSYAAPTNENKVLLLLDGHASHKNYEALKYARDHGVVLLCFPPHCTHRLQPLDVVFYAPLKTYFSQETIKWMKKNHPGRAVTQFQISGIFNSAYRKAASAGTATNGFRQTGIVPLNPDIFPGHLYSPANVTDRPEEETDVFSIETTETEIERLLSSRELQSSVLREQQRKHMSSRRMTRTSEPSEAFQPYTSSLVEVPRCRKRRLADNQANSLSSGVALSRKDRSPDECTTSAGVKKKKPKSDAGPKGNKTCKTLNEKPARRPKRPTTEGKPMPPPVFSGRENIHIRKPGWHVKAVCATSQAELAQPDEPATDPQDTPATSHTQFPQPLSDEPAPASHDKAATSQAEIAQPDEPATDPQDKPATKHTDTATRQFFTAADLLSLPQCTTRSNRTRSNN
jgi:hypothetical protein